MSTQGLIIDAISDTHNRQHLLQLRGGDVLIHSGDMTGQGHPDAIMQVLLWLQQQPYKHKIAIAGNHDWDFEKNPEFWKEKFAKHGVHLLNDSGLILKDLYDPAINIKVWGSPVQPWFHSWAFNRARTQNDATTKHPWIKNHWDLIPPDTEILVTHGPPRDILDMCVHPDGTDREGVGCDELLSKIMMTPSIKLHQFGHIHEARGHMYKYGKTFVNASSLDSTYGIQEHPVTRIVRDQDGVYMVES